ncbi:MAG TPA: carboxymuconolactone decarboxylase family protein [Streptosporangiaceae bacterium]|jgi:alkylhydroperoxidase family enzyme
MQNVYADEKDTAMARISLDPPKTLAYRIATRFARRKYGMMPDPGAAVGHNMQVARSYAIFELQVERWHALDTGLKDLAQLAAAARIGCSWCMDFGYWEATMQHDVPPEKIRAIPGWRDSDVFTELERLVLDYAEAMTESPPSVTDEMVARLSGHFSEPQLVELTAIVAVENLRSRMNAALGLTAQGFKDRCELRPASGAAAGRVRNA